MNEEKKMLAKGLYEEIYADLFDKNIHREAKENYLYEDNYLYDNKESTDKKIDDELKKIAVIAFSKLVERRLSQQKKKETHKKPLLEENELIYVHDFAGKKNSGMYRVVTVNDTSLALMSEARRTCLPISTLGKEWSFEKVRSCLPKSGTVKTVRITKKRIRELVGQNIVIRFKSGRGEGYSVKVLRFEKIEGIEYLVVRKEQGTKEKKYSFCSFNKDWEAYEKVIGK